MGELMFINEYGNKKDPIVLLPAPIMVSGFIRR
jgi:hypothetical protein